MKELLEFIIRDSTTFCLTVLLFWLTILPLAAVLSKAFWKGFWDIGEEKPKYPHPLSLAEKEKHK
jgi:ABC-type sulfate transport system permease component